MTAIEKVTIGATAEEGRAIFAGSSGARVLSIGNAWTKMRIGCRMSFEDPGGTLVGPRLRVGVMSNPDATLSNGPLSATCSHYWGSGILGNITRTGGTPNYLTIPMNGVKKIGATETTTSGTSTNYAAAPTTYRNVFILDFWKGADGTGNWAFGGVFCYVASYYQDCTKAILIAAMSAGLGSASLNDGLTAMRTQLAASFGITIGGLTQAIFSSTYNLHEGTNGPLNALVVGWDQATYKMHLSELMFISYS